MFLYPEGCTPIYKGGIVSKPAPGMQNAMVILTARVQNMEGNYSADEYVELLRCEAESQDPMILISAMASLATALLAIAANGTKIPPHELLSTIGLRLVADA